MSSSNRRFDALIKQSSNYDKDERYMATSDLLSAMNGNVKIDQNMERRICSAVLEQLKDTSHDVQTIAVKCLQTLVKKVEEAQVSDICQKLCNLVLDGSGDLRDIYSIGLKTVLENFPVKMGPMIARQLTPRLLGGVQKDGVARDSAKLECLDILTSLLKLYGNFMAADHQNISVTALRQLGSEAVVAKRSTACLGQLSTVVSAELLDRIVQNLLQQIETPHGNVDKRTVIQTIGTISRMVGYRLGSHLGRIVPLFLGALKDPSDESMHTDAADELRENILHAFESFVMRCPQEVTEHIPAILEALLQFLQYDPNYNYDDSDEEMDGEGEEEDEYEDEDDYDDEDYSDEDDTSWKVRRASIKVLRAVVISRPEMLQVLYEQCAPLLLTRFGERDEYVRLDVIACYSELVNSCLIGRGTPAPLGGRPSPLERQRSGPSFGSSGGAKSLASQAVVAGRAHVLEMVAKDVPRVVKQSCKILKDKKNVKPKTAVFHMLSTVVVALRGGMDEHIDTLVPLILDCSKLERDSSLVHETLQFTGKLMELHEPSKVQPHVDKLCPAVLVCISAEWYKIVAEALAVVRVMTGVFRGQNHGADGSAMDTAGSFDCTPFVSPCYEAVLPRLEAHDIDMEIKENAIMAMAAIFSRLGDLVPAEELAKVLQLLHERLGNEITRLPALKCIGQIAASPLKLDLGPIVATMVSDLVHFFRQQSRTLKQHTLLALDELVKSSASSANASAALTPELFAQVLDGATKLIDGNDLYLSQMSISLCVSIVRAYGSNQAIMQLVANQVLPPCMQVLSKSGGLQGSGALDSLISFFKELVRLDDPGLSYETLNGILVAPVRNAPADAPLARSNLEALARCIAAVVLVCKDDTNRKATINKVAVDIDNGLSSCNFSHSGISLLIVGEIGRGLDLSSIAPGVNEKVLACLDHADAPEDVKSAAATALGNIVLGNMAVFLPALMKQVQNRTEQAQQYLLLSSLREVIVRHGSKEQLAIAAASIASGTNAPSPPAAPLPVDSMLPVLERHCQSEEEGVRNMVAECLGKLAVQSPGQIIPYIAGLIPKAEQPLMRWTLVTSLKYASGGERQAVSQALKANMGPFVQLLSDQDILVRRAAIVAVNSIAHHRPEVIQDIAKEQILPLLFKATVIDPSLKRTVNLGPFKHTVDDGLPLRKASFSCILTMLYTMPNIVPISACLPHLAAGLADVDDVAMLCHQIVTHIVAYSPHALLSECNVILTPLANTIKKTPKAPQPGAMNHDSDVIRSALRALDSINSVPESAQNKKIAELVAQILGTKTLRELAEADHLAFLSTVQSA